MVGPDGVVPIQMVDVSAIVSLPLHHKSRSSILAPARPSGPGKRAVKRLWWWCVCQDIDWEECLGNDLSVSSGT